MHNYCIVLTTFENPAQAKIVIDRLLQDKLVACIQEMDIRSHYVWKENICNDNEVLVLMKTTDKLYDELKELMLEIHPYDTPEILRLNIEDGFKGYLSWIDEVTR